MVSEEDLEKFDFPLTSKDRRIILSSDEDFHLQSWEDLKDIIKRNDLAELARKPSDLLRYRQWCYEITVKYDTITNYLCQERLKWTPLPSSTPESGPLFDYKNIKPFGDPRDYMILLNDWPYGMQPKILHLVVWLKTKFPTEGIEGDLTRESRALIEDFVRRTFIEILPESSDLDRHDQVMWFKNWAGLQSVRGIEHVHVLVRDVPENILQSWLGQSDP